MSTRNYICILACTALLVSCAPEQKPKAPTTTRTVTRPPYSSLIGGASSTPTPVAGSPTPSPGKRTEQGTVIKLTTSQTTLQCTDGTWIINRTASTTVTGTLKVGYTVTVESNKEDWHQVSA
jgi:hypothetical protein